MVTEDFQPRKREEIMTPEQEVIVLRLRIQHVTKKSKARARSLRQLNKHVLFLQSAIVQANNAKKYIGEELIRERERQKRTDYRSVCQCMICRSREWYRFRNGETYPGRAGWRFLRFLPYWR